MIEETRKEWVMLWNQLLLFPIRPKPYALFHYAATIVALVIRSVWLTRTLETGQKKYGLVLDIWFLSHMASKCGKNKNVGHEAQPSVTDDHILTSSNISCWTDAQQRGIYLFHTTDKQIVVNGDVIYVSVQQVINKNQSKCLSHDYWFDL